MRLFINYLLILYIYIIIIEYKTYELIWIFNNLKLEMLQIFGDFNLKFLLGI